MSKYYKIPLYARTVSHLKPSQVLLRIKRRLGGLTQLKGAPIAGEGESGVDISRVVALSRLDFCPDFLARWDVDRIMRDEICILYHNEKVDWNTSWHEKLSTPLWQFNLHYFEYLLPLAKAYLDTRNMCYLEKGKQVIVDWIDACPQEKGGPAWDSYPIALRVTNWLAFYAELQDDLRQDVQFVRRLDRSLQQQYIYLSKHLETDLLANHYLEDLKALVILACYFDDRAYFYMAYAELKSQVAEQVLPDGMHFELSIMYHKVIFEDLMRVAACVHAYDASINVKDDMRLQDMANCLYSIEHNSNRTPLFNDAGNNVAKGKMALLECVKIQFGIEPVYRSQFENAGYCLLERKTLAGTVKLVFDAGQAGPIYAMGHAHCDALSIECFVDGEPWIVNMGTYAYQDTRRLVYKATRSHSTVFITGEEQYECWAAFRVANYGKTNLLYVDDSEVKAEFIYSSGIKIHRKVRLLENGLEVTDSVSSGQASSIFHIAGIWEPRNIEGLGIDVNPVPYAPEFGRTADAFTYQISFESSNTVFLPYPYAKQEEEDTK